MKLCFHCGERPRHVSKTGNVLTRCHECLQMQWRQHKTPANNGERARRKPTPKAEKPPKEAKPRKEKPIDTLRRELIASRHEVAELRKRIRELEGISEHLTRV